MIKIICIGKLKEQYIKDLVLDYLKRVNKYHKLEIIECLDSNIKEEKERILLILKRVVREFEIIIITTSSSLSDCIYSDAILVLDDGKIKYSGNLDDILKHDNDLAKLGIDIPIMMDMSLKLQFYDLLDKVILNAEEMVDELWD